MKKEISITTKEHETSKKESSTFKIIDFLVHCELADTRGEAKRLISQDGIKLNNKSVDKDSLLITVTNGDIVKRGKFRQVYIGRDKNGLNFSRWFFGKSKKKVKEFHIM